MRIGMLADVYKPHVSGVTHYIELNKRYLEEAGHEVFVFTFGEHADQGEARIIRSPGFPLMKTGYFLSLAYSPPAQQLLETMDVVHIQHPFVTGRIAIRSCRPLGIPMVFTNHTRYDLYARAYAPMVPGAVSRLLLRAYMPWFCRAMDLVISPSAGMASVLREMGVTSPIEITPNGIELDRFYGATALSRTDFGFTDNDILLVYAGRVANEKNLLFLIEAFSIVARAIDNAYLLIIGGGPPPIQSAMRNLAAELNLGQRLRLIGMVPYEALPSYLLMGDVFVTASVTEVHPLSVIEGMACGLPVVGIDSPGVGEIVEHGKTGLLAKEDLPSFAAALMRLCEDADLRRSMGAAARQASARYGIQRTSAALIQNYERLVRLSLPRRKSLAVRLRSFPEKHIQ